MTLEVAPTQPNGGNSQHLDVLSTHNQTVKMFECFYPAAEPTIKSIQESVPFPTNMKEALTYAVGYIDQGVTVSRTIEQKYEILEKRYNAATETISGNFVELEKFRSQTESHTSRITELEDTLTVQQRFSERLQRGISKLRSGEGSASDKEAPELMETREKLQLATEREKELKDKYDAAQKENADLKSKLATESSNSAGLQQDKTRLETSVVTQVQELLAWKKKFSQLSADFAEAKHHIDVDGHIIAGIQDQRELLAKTIREKTQEIDDIKKECAAARKSLKAQLDETIKKLEITEDEKKSVEEEYQGSLVKLKATEDAKKALEEEHQACAAKLKAVQDAKKVLEEEHQSCAAKLKAAEDAKKSIEEQHQGCAAKLKVAEDAKKALEAKLASVQAELEEAKKPVLDNKVVLKNPIAIAGSLRGAPDKVDDKFFPMPPLPFAVTIYDHSSTKLFVTDNGMICFDADIKEAAAKRQGKPLPYHDGVPPYTLFPFWADLMLAKDKPHGIFYEITGETGARTLTVEWYVTRYGNEEQYFHFLVLLEEARPNVVTFKYYDAVDKGKQCTIGVQGASSSLMFSYNEAKVYPGLQIVFDTKTNKMVSSTFPI